MLSLLRDSIYSISAPIFRFRPEPLANWAAPHVSCRHPRHSALNASVTFHPDRSPVRLGTNRPSGQEGAASENAKVRRRISKRGEAREQPSQGGVSPRAFELAKRPRRPRFCALRRIVLYVEDSGTDEVVRCETALRVNLSTGLHWSSGIDHSPSRQRDVYQEGTWYAFTGQVI